MPDNKNEMKEIEKITGRLFIASDDREEHRTTWMESGKNPLLIRYAHFNSNLEGIEGDWYVSFGEDKKTLR